MLTLCLIYRRRLATLMGGYLYRIGDQPGRVVRHGYCDEAELAAEPFC